VVDVPDLSSTATVLDLGAGTGKLTRLLASTFDRVIAVEPAEAMRRVLVTLCPKAEAFAGTAQEIPLADVSVDAVYAGEAFHWFDDARALDEIARVLRPRGVLALMWNLPAGPTEPSIAAVEQLLTERGPDPREVSYDPLDLDGPQYTSGKWREAFAESSFEPLREARLPNPQTLDRDGLVAFFASMGWLADLAEEHRLPLLNEVRSLLGAGEYRRLWETHVHWTRALARTEVHAEVAVLVTRRIGREALLLHRAPEGGGYWHVVAGAVEPGETAAAAAKRELLEETGLEAAVNGGVEVAEYIHASTLEPADEPSRPDPEVVPVRVTCFTSSAPDGWEPSLDREHDAHRWTTAAEALATLRWPGTANGLRALVR